MGNIRTPKPRYFTHGIIEFYVKDKQIYYKGLLWLKDGLFQFEFAKGKYESDDQIQQIINKALQNFSNVMVNEEQC